MSEETIPQMREANDRLAKQLKEANSLAEKLAKENRTLAARDIFRDKGLDPKKASLFVGQHEGDVTEDAVVEFAKEFGFEAPVDADEVVDGDSDEAGSSDPTPAPGGAELADLSRGGSRAGDGGAGGAADKSMTRQEWQALAATDPAAAKAAVASGRVQISKDNIFSGQRPDPGNPYAPRE